MGEQFRRVWPVLRALLGVAVVAYVAWQLYRDLGKLPPRPRTQSIGYGWLALSAVLYLAGLGLSGAFWIRLLGHLDAAPGFARGIRAYFVSQMGKYAPGKALALVMRVDLVGNPRTPAATAALAAFYEVLTTMAVGVLIALALTPLVIPDDAAGVVWAKLWDRDAPHDPTRGQTALMALALLAVTALPLTPWLFNRMAAGVTRPFQKLGVVPPPPVRYRYLAEGFGYVAPCWALFGLALACGVAALPETDLAWTPATLGRLVVCMAIAYVGGFVVPTPGGLGGREFLLILMLSPMLAGGRPTAALVVLLIRLAWTVAEVILAGCLYLVPPPRGAS